MKTLLVTLLLLSISACSNTSDQLAGADSNNENKNKMDYRCEKIPVLGSSIPKKVCSTAAQRRAAEKLTQETAQQVRKPPNTCAIVDCGGV